MALEHTTGAADVRSAAAAPRAPAQSQGLVNPEPLKLAELNTEQVRALNKDKTIVLIPGGILEEHGPYLPSFTDGYRNEATTAELARAVTARPGWTALVLPTIPLGVGGANELGGRFSFPGTYAVRSSTLRAVFVDLASDLGEQGFRWIFVVHLHGAPSQHRALDDAGDYFHDTYGGRMVHLYGLMPVLTAGAPRLDPADRVSANARARAARTRSGTMQLLVAITHDAGLWPARTAGGAHMETVAMWRVALFIAVWLAALVPTSAAEVRPLWQSEFEGGAAGRFECDAAFPAVGKHARHATR